MDAPDYTIKDYVDVEAYSNIKHEFDDGVIRAMGGGTLEHSRLAAALILQLGRQLEDGPCTVYTSDARVRVVGQPFITYPDISVGCCEPTVDIEDPLAQTNPAVLVEITSPSSERYDRGKEFARYQGIPSLREYVVVSHREPVIDVFRRLDDGGWTDAERYGAGERARLESIGCTIDVDKLLRRRA